MPERFDDTSELGLGYFRIVAALWRKKGIQFDG
jgi:hypothetical protein